MFNFVQGSKYVAETISVVLSFTDLLLPLETITGTPVITVTVFSGLDSNPTNILYQGVTVTGGNTIEQRFRLGVVGVIYQINLSVQTSLGDTLDKECYLAILPDENNAVPTWLPLWESTQLYPYQLLDQFTSKISFVGGRLAIVVYNIPHEDIQSHIMWVGGTLISSGKTYSIPHEDLKSSIEWLGGTLQNTTVSYNIPHEDIKSAIAWLGGTLENASITYNIPHEDLRSSIVFTGGTLV